MELKSDNCDENRDCKWKTKSDEGEVESGSQNGSLLVGKGSEGVSVPRCRVPPNWEAATEGAGYRAVLYFTKSGSVGTLVPSLCAKNTLQH